MGVGASPLHSARHCVTPALENSLAPMRDEQAEGRCLVRLYRCGGILFGVSRCRRAHAVFIEGPFLQTESRRGCVLAARVSVMPGITDESKASQLQDLSDLDELEHELNAGPLEGHCAPSSLGSPSTAACFTGETGHWLPGPQSSCPSHHASMRHDTPGGLGHSHRNEGPFGRWHLGLAVGQAD